MATFFPPGLEEDYLSKPSPPKRANMSTNSCGGNKGVAKATNGIEMESEEDEDDDEEEED